MSVDVSLLKAFVDFIHSFTTLFTSFTPFTLFVDMKLAALSQVPEIKLLMLAHKAIKNNKPMH